MAPHMPPARQDHSPPVRDERATGGVRAARPSAGGMVPALCIAIGILFSLSPVATPALALAAGLLCALAGGNPWARLTGRASTVLLQASVVGLGFGIPLERLISGGVTGVAVTALMIALTFGAGLLLATALSVERNVATLITAGTSICGGSAIAALGPAIGAGREAMGMSLITVFMLNAVALYLFPPIGHLFDLSQHQFGVWAALAIHDTSSVVGAAASYGPEALQDATVLKLARALWILPLVVLAAATRRGSDERNPGSIRPPIPWFTGAFVLAAIARSLSAADSLPYFDLVARAGRIALVTTLFLLGASLTRDHLRRVGIRPLVLGLVLWTAVAGLTLLGVLAAVA